MTEDVTMANVQPSTAPTGKLFTIKKLNVVAYWSWDVQSDNCAICRSAVMGITFHISLSLSKLLTVFFSCIIEPCFRCQQEGKAESCVGMPCRSV